jgi:uncharacterized protein YggU (UPF0235/DUF167 family)
VLGFLEDGTLRMSVTAPPVDGAANIAVRVTHGKTARRKIVQVTGLSEAEVRERLTG